MSTLTLERNEISAQTSTPQGGVSLTPEVPLYRFTDIFYAQLYNGRGEKSDSTTESRTNLVREARKYVQALGKNDFVLDLGSGPQIFERLYFQANRTGENRPQPRFITVDRAEIQSHHLLMHRSNRITNIQFGGEAIAVPQVVHVKASGEHLPFPDASIGFVISNMALDFMGDSAVTELHRVMKPGAHALIRLHHPSLYPDPEILNNPWISSQERIPLRFWEVLRERGVLTDNPDEIYRRFAVAGFDIQELKLARDRRLGRDHKDKWWELDIAKPEKGTSK